MALPTENAANSVDQIKGGRGKPQAGDIVPTLPGGQTQDDVNKKDQQIAKQEGKLEEKDDNKKDGSLKIHINLDLDVEVHLTARVKGDITIGLL